VVRKCANVPVARFCENSPRGQVGRPAVTPDLMATSCRSRSLKGLEEGSSNSGSPKFSANPKPLKPDQSVVVMIEAETGDLGAENRY